MRDRGRCFRDPDLCPRVLRAPDARAGVPAMARRRNRGMWHKQFFAPVARPGIAVGQALARCFLVWSDSVYRSQRTSNNTRGAVIRFLVRARASAIVMCAALVACTTVKRPLMPAFEAKLAANESATIVLQDWCRDHRLAEPAAIHAEQIKGENVLQFDERRLLQVGDHEPL